MSFELIISSFPSKVKTLDGDVVDLKLRFNK